MIEAVLYDLLNESIKVNRLLTQIEVKDYFSRTATYDNRFTQGIASYSFGKGAKSCLCVTFGDSEETACGTGLVTLGNLLQRGTCNFRNLPVTWHFAPGIDLATNQGITSFRSMLKNLQPDFVYAISDNLLQNPEQLARFILKRPISEKHSSMIREMFIKSGIKLDNVGVDPLMGQGFYLATATHEPLIAEIPKSCQFLQPIFCHAKDILPADLVFLYMATGLLGIDSIT